MREWYCVDAICETPEGLADSPVQVAAKWVDGRLDWPKKADLLAVFQFAATVVDWRPGLLTGHYLVAMVVREASIDLDLVVDLLVAMSAVCNYIQP